MADKPVDTRTAQARANCKLDNEILAELNDGLTSNPSKIDCSKLTPPADQSLEQLQQRGEDLRAAKSQLRAIDPRRAY